jgi:hypothetical protein
MECIRVMNFSTRKSWRYCRSPDQAEYDDIDSQHLPRRVFQPRRSSPHIFVIFAISIITLSAPTNVSGAMELDPV